MAENKNVMIAKEIRKRDDSELLSLLQSKTEELHKARFKHALGQLSQTHIVKALKKDIARVQTVLRERRKESQV